MQNIFQIVPFYRFLRIEEFEEFLHKLRSDIGLELLHLNGFIDYELEEKFIDSLEVRPGGVHFFFLVDTSLSKSEIALFHIGKWAENVLFDHLHDLVQVGDDESSDRFLVAEHLLKLVNCVETFRFTPHIFRLVLVVVGLHTQLQLLQKLVF